MTTEINDMELKNKAKDLIEKAINQNIVVKRLIYYFYDWKTKNAVLYKDTSLQEVWNNEQTEETFSLNEVAFYYEGIPVYFVIRDFNISVGLDFFDDNRKLVEKGYSASDVHAKIQSQYIDRVFKQANKVDTRWIFTIIVLCSLCIACTVIVFLPYVLV